MSSSQAASRTGIVAIRKSLSNQLWAFSDVLIEQGGISMMEEVVKKRLLEFRGNREALTDEYFNKLSELYQIICQMYQAVKNTGKDHQLLQVIKLVDFIYGDDTKERLKEISQEENNIGFYVAIYGVYKKTDLDQYRKLKVNGKSYFYLKGRLEINEQLFEELKAVPNQETRIFVEHVHGQLVFT